MYHYHIYSDCGKLHCASQFAVEYSANLHISTSTLNPQLKVDF